MNKTLLTLITPFLVGICVTLLMSPRLASASGFEQGTAGNDQSQTDQSAQTRPNVLWFVVDDMSPHFSCYGESLIQTPHVDRLAKEGTLFRHAFVTAPVCSACRSALITGMYQTAIGAHHHRSGRGVAKISLPENIIPLPELFRRSGYYTCIGDGIALQKTKAITSLNGGPAKTDYNFEWDLKMYDGRDWSGRSTGQPFFMQVQLPGGKMRGDSEKSAQQIFARAQKEFGKSTDPERVVLPPYYPRHPVLLDDWAAYLDSVRFTDKYVGAVIARLETEGILDQTLIIFMTDHGISHARGKQFLYDEGTHIPFIVRGPGIPQGAIRDDLIEQIDMGPSSLGATGIAIPPMMQGQDIFAENYHPRDAVFGARDRCDETVDRIRSVRTDRYLYIRNFFPQRPMLQPNAYKDGKAIVKTLRQLHADQQLDEQTANLLFRPTRPVEELYEWQIDRWQLNNLANTPEHADTLSMLRKRLDRWMSETNDQGAEPEADSMYTSDMEAWHGNRHDPQTEVIHENIRTMKKWAAEGK